MEINQICGLIGLLILIILTILVHSKEFKRERVFNPIKFISRCAIFGALSAILYTIPVFKFSIPFLFPPFLEIHLDEAPAFICGFAYGPLSGFYVIAIKTLVKLVISGSHTFLIGELSDIILSSVYVVSVTFIYKKKRNLKGVAIGFGIGSVIQIITAMLLNVYILIPAYVTMIGEKALLGMMSGVKLFHITDVRWSYAFLGVLPFNFVKNIIVIVITFLLYKALHIFLRRFADIKPKE